MKSEIVFEREGRGVWAGGGLSTVTKEILNYNDRTRKKKVGEGALIKSLAVSLLTANLISSPQTFLMAFPPVSYNERGILAFQKCPQGSPARHG